MATAEEFTFEHKGGDWDAFNRAKSFLKDHGYSVGSMQRGAPVGAVHGYFRVPKWRKLSSDEREAMDVVLRPLGSLFKDSDVTVEIRPSAPNIDELRQSRCEMLETTGE